MYGYYDDFDPVSGSVPSVQYVLPPPHQCGVVDGDFVSTLLGSGTWNDFWNAAIYMIDLDFWSDFLDFWKDLDCGRNEHAIGIDGDCVTDDGGTIDDDAVEEARGCGTRSWSAKALWERMLMLREILL